MQGSGKHFYANSGGNKESLYQRSIIFQVSLARLGAGFGSALTDIFQSESLRILAERISDGRLDSH